MYLIWLRRCLITLFFASNVRLMAASQPIPMSRAECAYTQGAAEDVFYEIDEPASRFGGEGEKLHLMQNATLRALLVFRICPSIGEDVLAHNPSSPSSTGRWITIIGSSSMGPESIYYIELAVTGIQCRKSAPLLCGVKQKIEAALQDRKAREQYAGRQKLSFQEKIVSDAADEFTAATGQILAATDNVALVLSVFPEQFYAYMEVHPDVLDRWLDQASATLFRGDPDGLADRVEYKRLLIARVEKYRLAGSQHVSTMNKVLKMLKSAPVSSID